MHLGKICLSFIVTRLGAFTSAWDLLSENVEADKTKLFELADADIPFWKLTIICPKSFNRNGFSNDKCGESISIIRKALSVGESSDALTISGTIEELW